MGFGKKQFLLVLSLTVCIAVSTVADALALTIESKVDVLDTKPVVRPEFPVPDDKNLLFYIQRSTNSNTIVYVADLAGSGQLENAFSVRAYWRRFNTTGETKPLNYLEEKLAFGIVTSPSSKEKNAFNIHLTSFPQRVAVVKLDERRTAIAITNMGRHRARLLYAYVAVDESSIFPWVNYVDLFGIDLESGKFLRERLRPVGRQVEPPATR